MAINFFLRRILKKLVLRIVSHDDKCFKYAITVALNHEQINRHVESISNIKTFIDQLDRKEINFPSNKKDWDEFEKIIKQ